MYQCDMMEGRGFRNAREIGEGVLRAEEESASLSQTWGWWVDPEVFQQRNSRNKDVQNVASVCG